MIAAIALLLTSTATAADISKLLVDARENFYLSLDDKFHEYSVDDPPVGQEFSLVLRFRDNASGSNIPRYLVGDARFTYHNGEMSFHLDVDDLRVQVQGAKFQFAYATDRKKNRSFIGTNAFGGKVNVNSYSVDRYAIGAVEAPIFIRDERGYVFNINVDGEKARSLALYSAARITGRVARFSDGHATACMDSADRATFTSPVERYYVTCLLAVRIDTVEFVDTRTMKPMVSWKLMPDENSSE